MFDLDNIYSDHKISPENPLCEGCSILDKRKPCHSVMDYEMLGESEVLFLSDSLKSSYGKTFPFTKPEYAVIKKSYSGQFACAASVKCPSVKEADMSPDNMKLCRSHLQATIDKVKPKLVLPCGNLAMKMLIKKSGISDKRGKSFEYVTDNGHSCTVVPIYHPYFVAKEPRHRFLFETDIRNAHDKYVLGRSNKGDFSYEVLMDIEDVKVLAMKLDDCDDTMAVDIETTGLNFLQDKIQTISFSTKTGNWVLPLDHKDSPFRKGEPHYSKVWILLRRILENPKSKKVFHNAKFDLKFLINYGIYTKNVWDTKIMHHLLDENLPKSLMDLVKLYFPTELESL
jgi:lipocalin